MKLDILQGATSQRIVVFIQSSIATNGAGLTGLTSSSSGLTWYYWRPDTGNSGGTPVSLAAATRGTYTSGGIVEIDSTNLPGFYELGLPTGVTASTSDTPTWVVMMLQGATSMVPCAVEIQLTAYNPYSATNLGLSALPTASPAANGGLPTVNASNGVTLATQQVLIKKDAALANFMFAMLSSSGTAVTGATITSTVAIDGGSFGSTTNSAAEISGGWYKINLAAADLNGTNIALRFTATGAVDTDILLITQP